MVGERGVSALEDDLVVLEDMDCGGGEAGSTTCVTKFDNGEKGGISKGREKVGSARRGRKGR